VIARALTFLLLALALLATTPGGEVYASESGRSAVVHPPQVPAPLPAIASGTLHTERFRLVHTPRSEAAARALAERVEQTRAEFVRVLGRDWPGVTEIRVGMGREEFEALALPHGAPPRWAEAVAYPAHNVVLVEARTLTQAQGELTLRHELSHVALGRLGTGWPAWFQEGLAKFLTGDRLSLGQYAAIFRAVQQDRVFRFEHLADAWPHRPEEVDLAYAQSVAFLAWLVERHGQPKLGELIGHVGAGATFEVAFARAFHSSINVEEGLWRDELPARYSWTPVLTGGSMIWAVAALIAVMGYVRRRRQRAVRQRELEQEELALQLAALQDEAEEAPEPDLAQGESFAEPAGASSPQAPAEGEGTLPPDGPPRRLLH
jgi:hypothetical protein